MEEKTHALGSMALIHAGLQDLDVARRCLESIERCGGVRIESLLTALERACDPDSALLDFTDIIQEQTSIRTPKGQSSIVPAALEVMDAPSAPDRGDEEGDEGRTGHQPSQAGIVPGVLDDERAVGRVIRVLGASQAMGRLMQSRPKLVLAAAFDPCGSVDWDRDERIGHMVHAVKVAAADDASNDEGICADCRADSFFAVRPASDRGDRSRPGGDIEHQSGVGGHGGCMAHASLNEAVCALRRSYYDQLAAIMAFDLEADDPVSIQPEVSERLSDLADATLEGALAIARSQVDGSEDCRFTIMAMGKLGARELNYVSDVDVMYVVEPAETAHDTSERKDFVRQPSSVGTVDAAALTRIGTQLAKCVQSVCQGVIPAVTEPPLWQIDANLRPEGKDGILVRTVDGYRGYYEKWAKNWEFQALLKARPAAGDREVGEHFLAMSEPMVWQASKRDNFVYDCQKMRVRVEDNIEPSLREREIKLGKGGLRDIEFSVQMLQLVHGRTDKALRRRSTLGALAALTDGGYVSRRQSQWLGQDYRFERVMEHRQQMWQLKRTHLFPEVRVGQERSLRHQASVKEITGNRELRRLGRAFGLLPDRMLLRYQEVRREVHRLHADIYYRPMLPISAQLDDDQVNLDEKATKERFESIGFQDPDAAMRHVRALTDGVSRAARINRILLPAVLGWLANGQNPDMGLLGWRKLEENFGDGSPYLGFLRDSPQAAERLCHVLSNSRMLSEALCRSVESITWLGDDEKLKATSREALEVRCGAAMERYRDARHIEDFATSIRAVRRREIERIGLSWMSGVMGSDACLTAMTDVYDAMVGSALKWAVNKWNAQLGLSDSPADITVIAMGRYGGREVNFSSDADIIVIYRPREADDVASSRIGGGSDGRIVSASRDASTPASGRVSQEENGGVGYAGRQAVETSAFVNSVVTDMRMVLEGPISRERGVELDFGLRPEGKNGPIVRSYDSCKAYYTSWYSTWERQALLRARFCAGDEALADDFLHELADPLRYPARPLSDDELGEIRRLKARMEAERLPRAVSRSSHLKLGSGGLSDVEWTVQLLQLQHAGTDRRLRTTSTLPALRELEASAVISHDDAETLSVAWRLCTDARNGNYLFSGRAAQADVIPSDYGVLGAVATFLGYDAHRGQYFENDLRAVMRRCRAVMQRLFYGQ